MYLLASTAGMPARILDPYLRYIDNLNIRCKDGPTIVVSHGDECSIPQGCPFSMTMVANWMLPRIHLMRGLDVEPMVLADGLLFTGVGRVTG